MNITYEENYWVIIRYQKDVLDKMTVKHKFQGLTKKDYFSFSYGLRGLENKSTSLLLPRYGLYETVGNKA